MKRPNKISHGNNSTTGPDLLNYPYTDLGNAQRLITMFGDQIRFCAENGLWLIWDGKRWKPDDGGRVRLYAKRAMRAFHFQAMRTSDPDIRKAAETHSRNSDNPAAITALLKCAESESEICINISDLDRNKWLMNVQNGTIDLRTGRLLPHRPEDTITKISPVNFNPSAECPTFMAFLHRTLRSEQKVAELMRLGGQALVGPVNEQAICRLFGEDRASALIVLKLFRYLRGDESGIRRGPNSNVRKSRQ